MLIGLVSVLIQVVIVGNGAVIGAGSVFLRDVRDHETVVGLVK